MSLLSPPENVIRYIAAVACLICQTCMADDPAEADFARSRSYRGRTANLVYRDSVSPVWIDSDRFWYRVRIGRDAFEFYLVDARRGKQDVAFDHVRLAKLLAAETGEIVQANRLPFDWIAPVDDAIEFDAFGSSWRYERSDGSLQRTPENANVQQRYVGVELLDHVQASSSGGGSVVVTIHNNSDRRVELFWVRGDGDRKSYGTIDPHAERKLQTYAGHAWICRPDRGKHRIAFRARAAIGRVYLTDDAFAGDGFPVGAAATDGELVKREQPARRHTSPDGRWRIEIRDSNVFLIEIGDAGSEGQTKMPVQLSHDGTPEDAYRPPAYWSPDSKSVVVMRRSKGLGREIHLIEAAPDNQIQPKLITHRYAKPGDRLPVDSPRMFRIGDGAMLETDAELVGNAWSVSRIHWTSDSTGFLFLVNQRGHQRMRVIHVDAQTGVSRCLVDEHSKTFIDYAGKLFLHYTSDDRLFWMSERDGWNHLYRFDIHGTTEPAQITRGQWVVRRVEHVDTTRQQIWFSAGGVLSGQDPYFEHLCRVNFDGSGFVVLTKGNGNHRWEFTKDRRYIIDRYSRVNLPPVTQLLRSEDGALVCQLQQADWSALREGWIAPEPFVAKGRDGKTNIHGIIIRPTNFDPAKRYPVIESIYAGPHGFFVPKDFGLYPAMYELAELGFIVVKIDGMGTSGRSKAFHDVAWKNLGDSGFPDRIAWIKAAAAKEPAMDLSRVGIYGGSAGGQSALRALLAHGDFYHAAAADCGCHDNRMDKVWWNELWMGWPVGPHYAEQSNVTQAHRLQGKLLLTVGALDRNVDPSSTMQVVDALIKSDKDFELIVFPSGGHGVGESAYGRRRRQEFFVRHLITGSAGSEVFP